MRQSLAKDCFLIERTVLTTKDETQIGFLQERPIVKYMDEYNKGKFNGINPQSTVA